MKVNLQNECQKVKVIRAYNKVFGKIHLGIYQQDEITDVAEKQGIPKLFSGCSKESSKMTRSEMAEVIHADHDYIDFIVKVKSEETDLETKVNLYNQT